MKQPVCKLITTHEDNENCLVIRRKVFIEEQGVIVKFERIASLSNVRDAGAGKVLMKYA